MLASDRYPRARASETTTPASHDSSSAMADTSKIDHVQSPVADLASSMGLPNCFGIPEGVLGLPARLA